MSTSTRRQRQAEATRRDILLAARRLFGERGYAGTSMAEIAAAADVAVPTIYASVGSKRELVLALVDVIDEEAGLGELAPRLVEASEPRELVAVGVRLTRQIHERCEDLIDAIASAATVEPDAAAALQEGFRRHREGFAGAARRLAGMGALRPGTTAEHAAAVMSVMTWRDVYVQLTREYGWSFDDCERWMVETLCAQLLRDGPAA
jgi:AcrR family transcriptional regulator